MTPTSEYIIFNKKKPPFTPESANLGFYKPPFNSQTNPTARNYSCNISGDDLAN